MRYFLSVVFVLLFGVSSWADNFYCVIFASDCISPRYCHVWGTFVQMKEEKLVKEVTISWAPVGGWNVLDRRKPGYHMTLADSMNLSGKNATCVWGPFEIDEDFFHRAESSHVTPGYYKCFDTLSRDADNCIHKLGKVSGKRVITHVRYGKFAAHAVYVHYLNNNLLYSTDKGDKIMDVLYLNNYLLKKMK